MSISPRTWPGYSARLIYLLILTLFSASSMAHQASDSYLVVDASRLDVITIDWSILLQDLEVAVGLDVDNDARVTRSEFDQRAPAIAAYALKHLSLSSAQSPCRIDLSDVSPGVKADQPNATVRATANCKNADALIIDYSLLFDLDTTHRGLLRLVTTSGEQTAVLSPSYAVQEFDLNAGNDVSALHFVREGIHHILIGYDHIAFLILLLLPATLVRRESGWAPVASPVAATLDVLRVVTAFTLAHSITLGLAATGILNIPVPLAELAIALSVVAAGLANFMAVTARFRWMLAFGFGLVHGIGFASVFAELGVSAAGLLPVLLFFNIGVELGQLAIVLFVLPIIYVLSRRRVYQRAGFQLASGTIAALGLFWVFQRVQTIL